MAKKHKSKPQKKPPPKAKPLPLDQQVTDYRTLGKPFAAKHAYNPFGGRR